MTQRISMWQAIIIFSLTWVYNVSNYIPSFQDDVEGTAMLYGAVLAFFIQILIIIPAIVLNYRFNKDTVITLGYKKSKVFGVILSIVYLIVTLLTIIGNCRNFNFFIINAVFPSALTFTIAMVILIPCAVCALAGFEPLARAATIIFVIVLSFSVFIGAVATRDISFLNIRPIMDEPVRSVLSYTFHTISKNSELFAIILLLPKIKAPPAKFIGIYLTFTCVFHFLAVFVMQGVLGNYAHTQVFPYFVLTAVLEVPIFQRLDSIYMIIWIFVSFVRISLFFYLAGSLLQPLLPQKARKFSVLFIFIAVTPVILLSAKKLDLLKENGVQSFVPIFVAVTILPLIMLFISKKEKENNLDETDKKTVVIADNRVN